MQTNNLFVYGSLMSGIQSPIAKYLKTNSIFLGEGTVLGQLFDVGQYPGLVADTTTESRVVGHVFQMNDPVAMLPNLDYYECVGADFPQPNEYRRAIIEVNLAGKKVDCWVYLYQADTTNLKLIESGNYLAYFEENLRYQRFVRSLDDFSRR